LALVGRVLDGEASGDELATFRSLLREYPELIEGYRQQTDVDTLACWKFGKTAGTVCDVGRPTPRWRAVLGWAAAAAAIAAAATTVWRGDALGLSRTRHRPDPETSAPAQCLRQTDATGLELPEVLPGVFRLASGEATVRLPSGVELTALGPFEADVRDAMRMRLKGGRLLVHVPSDATGFTVQTASFEIRDLGTVFGVAVDGDNVGMFVYAGRAQVQHVSGDAVTPCEEGEGMCVFSDALSQKIAVDGNEARRVFAPVRGLAALRNPVAAFAAAERIAELWTERHGPQVVPQVRPPVAGVRKNETRVDTPVSEVRVARPSDMPPEIRGERLSRIPGTRRVTVDYDLHGAEAVVTLEAFVDGAALPASAVAALSGDVGRLVQPGRRRIVWETGEDAPLAANAGLTVRLKAWSLAAPPPYLVVDLANGSAAASYPVRYYAGADAIPGGVTDDRYKTVMLVMRHLPPTGAAGFQMGAPKDELGWWLNEERHTVALTKGFYIGLYEVTQQQWQQVMGDLRPWPAYFANPAYRAARPVERVSYYDIRENGALNEDDPSVNWPVNDLVNAESFIGRLRLKTEMAGFDLPTEAQWEYACRAGTVGALNDGTPNLKAPNSDARLTALARYQTSGNVFGGAPSADCALDKGTAAVGSFKPNAWGLYDMHGNVWEWCLDWGSVYCGSAKVEDPVGALFGAGRVMRGGGWNNPAIRSRSAARATAIEPSLRNYNFGFRLVANPP
jgi:formylglycine-generating enzyme required for sulfatase activity/ferric-dicitrate binding protein FerR (iron transport regulator)